MIYCMSVLLLTMYVIFLSESAWLTTSTRWIDFSKVGMSHYLQHLLVTCGQTPKYCAGGVVHSQLPLGGGSCRLLAALPCDFFPLWEVGVAVKTERWVHGLLLYSGLFWASHTVKVPGSPTLRASKLVAHLLTVVKYIRSIILQGRRRIAKRQGWMEVYKRGETWMSGEEIPWFSRK